jgi:hypothetical protein
MVVGGRRRPPTKFRVVARSGSLISWYFLLSALLITDDYREVMLEATSKPWPARLSTLGLVIDRETSMPPSQRETILHNEEKRFIQMTRPANRRSLSDFDMARHRLGRVAAGPTRPILRRSTTQVGLRGTTQIQPAVPRFIPPTAPEPVVKVRTLFCWLMARVPHPSSNTHTPCRKTSVPTSEYLRVP